MRWNLGHPTRFSTAMIIAVISTFLVFIAVEAIIIVLRDMGFPITLSETLLLVIWVGSIISFTLMLYLTQRGIVKYYN